MQTQQVQYEQFIERGHTILERADPACSDTVRINQQIDEVNAGWDRVHQRLGERAASLTDVLDVSTKFYEAYQVLSETLGVLTDKMDALESTQRVEEGGNGGEADDEYKQLQV